MNRFSNNTRNRFYVNKGNNVKKTKSLDPSLFINKAAEESKEAEYISQANFSDFPIVEKLKRNILDHGYKNPTFIQEKAIPELLKGHDVIGIANTGTGKTAAFLIPLLNKIYQDRNQRALILAPTREIAIQIQDELNIFKKGMDIESILLIGGAHMGRQKMELRHKPHFVIGTPGRVKDHIQTKNLDMNLFQNVVLDEVDRMVDIGFVRDIRYFISLLPPKRQSLFFSATFSQEVDDILKHFVHDPITISVKVTETVDRIDQDIIRIQGGAKKIDVLHDLLIQKDFTKVLIFGRTKWGVEKLSKALVQRGFRASAIHGNKSLNQRVRALTDFKENRIQILLATDVASRGLDIDNVSHVINYDAPQTQEDYTHRIGRTGRAGKRGIALTFVE